MHTAHYMASCTWQSFSVLSSVVLRILCLRFITNQFFFQEYAEEFRKHVQSDWTARKSYSFTIFEFCSFLLNFSFCNHKDQSFSPSICGLHNSTTQREIVFSDFPSKVDEANSQIMSKNLARSQDNRFVIIQ